MTRPRLTVLLILAALVLVVCALAWHLHHQQSAAALPAAADPRPAAVATNVNTDAASYATSETAPTLVHAHNLLLHKGPNFRVFISWIRGQMLRTQARRNPSFDDPETFVLEIDKGIIRANIGDIANFLNSSLPASSPLKNVSLTPEGEELRLRGTVHKMISLPVELIGSLAPVPDGRIRYHVRKLNVLKLPLKGLLGGFHVELADLVHVKDLPGVQIVDNDILFDTRSLLPPPHIHGLVTAVLVRPPDIQVIYGNAPVDEHEMAKWRNFLRLENGTIDFGKITMRHVDLTMIDASKDAWFDLDLVNYQAQLVNGYTRMTAQAGMEIYMPDLDERASKKGIAKSVTLEWLKNRDASLPPDVKLK